MNALPVAAFINIIYLCCSQECLFSATPGEWKSLHVLQNFKHRIPPSGMIMNGFLWWYLLNGQAALFICHYLSVIRIHTLVPPPGFPVQISLDDDIPLLPHPLSVVIRKKSLDEGFNSRCSHYEKARARGIWARNRLRESFRASISGLGSLVLWPVHTYKP